MPIDPTAFSRVSVGLITSTTSIVDADPADTGPAFSVLGDSVLDGAVTFGTSGTASTGISSQTVTLTLPAVTANDSVTSSIPFIGVSLGDSIIVTPDSDWSTDIVLTAFAAADAVTVVANNSTITDITPSPQPARLTAIKFASFV